jgi:hypothetical protein
LRGGQDVRKFRDDKMYLLNRITLEEREIQTLFTALDDVSRYAIRDVGD